MLSLVLACCPAFFIYLFIPQLPLLSRTRLGILGLSFLALALIAYLLLPPLRPLTRGQKLIILIVPAILSLFGSAALTFFPDSIYPLSPLHTLKVEVLDLKEGQTLEVRGLQTSLGEIQYDAFKDLQGWKRQGSILVPASASPPPLIWTGWTGDSALLHFQGSSGVKINAAWDGGSNVIELGGTGAGVLAVQQQFELPLWTEAALALILWAALVYGTLLVWALNNLWLEGRAGNRMPRWLSLCPLPVVSFFVLMLAVFWLILNSKVPVADWELLSVITLDLLFIVPLILLLSRPSYPIAVWFQKMALDEKVKPYRLPVVLLLSAAVVYLVFGQSLQANWSVIDDHEIVFFLGPDGRLSLPGMFALLPNTEIGQFGHFTRFRPSYFFLRLLESVLWGAHPLYWHAFRLILLTLALSLFWMLLSSSLGFITSGLLCIYALTFPYLADTIGTLGPGESYAILGLPIYIWGAVKALQDGKRSKGQQALAGAAILLGSLICMGSKENLLLLLLPTLYIAGRALKNGEFTLFAFAAGGILFGAWVSTAILLAVTRSGTDIYANSIAPGSRVGKILSGLDTPQNRAALLALIALMLSAALLLLPSRLPSAQRRAALWSMFWLGAFLLVYLSQMYFYDGLWPTGIRYDFPGLLYIPASLYVITRLGERLMPKAASLAPRASLSAALLVMILLKGFAPITQGIAINVAQTNKFMRRVDAAVSLLQAHKDYALVIESGDLADYEPIFSYKTFLQSYGVDNDFFLRLHGTLLEKPASGLEDVLTANLLKVSMNGNADFRPLRELDGYQSKCFSLGISESYTTECQSIP